MKSTFRSDPVNDVAEILADPHVRARKLVGSFDYAGVGEFKALAHPVQVPRLGQPADRPAAGARRAHRERADRAAWFFARADLQASREQGDMTIELKVLEGGGGDDRAQSPGGAQRAQPGDVRRAVRFTQEISKQENRRLVFVRGNGPAFCGGADLNERKGKSEEWIRERRMRAFAAYGAIESLPMPCVALVHGAVIGSGVEIAAACDFIVATPSASFRTPEAQRGTRRRHAAPAAHPRQAPGEGPDVHRPGTDGRGGAHRRLGRARGGRPAQGGNRSSAKRSSRHRRWR